MDQSVRNLAEDQVQLSKFPGDVVDETLETGEKGVRTLQNLQGYHDYYNREIRIANEKAALEGEKEQPRSESGVERASSTQNQASPQTQKANVETLESSRQEQYETLLKETESDNPVGKDREIAMALIEADLDDATIEAILSESPEFKELSQIQGEEKARQYLDLIVDDAKRQDFLNNMQNEKEIQTVEILDREEEQ